MSLVFREDDKFFEMEILGYAQDCVKDDDDPYTANWLMVYIYYRDNHVSFEEEAPILLNIELKNFAMEIDSLIKGERDGFSKGFMEPYLYMAIKRQGHSFTFAIFYPSSDVEDWKWACVKQSLTLEELITFKNTLLALYENYPLRKEFD